jgi:hypothetical protein
VYADPHAPNAVDHPVDERHGQVELFRRIAARRQCRAHERPRVAGRKRRLAQHRLVELHEVGAGVRQLGQLGPQQRHDVLGQCVIAGPESYQGLLPPTAWVRPCLRDAGKAPASRREEPNNLRTDLLEASKLFIQGHYT